MFVNAADYPFTADLEANWLTIGFADLRTCSAWGISDHRRAEWYSLPIPQPSICIACTLAGSNYGSATSPRVFV
jgi:hypothetical protein